MRCPSVLLAAVFVLLSNGFATGTNIWISQTGTVATGSAPPSSAATIAKAQHAVGQAGGSLYIWARPDAAKTLKNWSFLMQSTNPNVATITSSYVQNYNPTISGIPRWDQVGEPYGGFPTGTTGFETPLLAYTVFNGRGIGPSTTGTDPFYNAANNAWLIARFDYTLTGTIGQTSLFLQIGPYGLSNLGETSAATSAVFGSTTDAALNGNTQRLINSATADAQIIVSASQNANFNGDAKVDGRDFLIWQRGYGINVNATLSQGDANNDGAVNSADLSIWNQQYGTSGGLMAAVAVPEPPISMMAVAFLAVFCSARCRRFFGRQLTVSSLLVIAASIWLTAPGSASAQWGQTFKLTGSDSAPSDQFGYSVGAFNNIGIVGAYANGNVGYQAGSAYLFDVTTGLELFQLNASDGSGGDNFGKSVAISSDLAIVGAPSNDALGANSGAVYVFSTYTGQQLYKITPSDGTMLDEFGKSVALVGTTALIGSGSSYAGGNGSAYLFDLGYFFATEQFKLTASDGAAYDYFGSSVALDGSTAIVGAYGDDDAGSESGSAYLFDVATGDELYKLTASDANEGDRFGWSVGMGTNNTAIIGAPRNGNFDIPNSGAAYLFDSATGEEFVKMVASDDGAGDYYGYSVAGSGPNTMAVGAYGDNGYAGSIYIIDPLTGGEVKKITALGAASNAYFGTAVSMDGDRVIVGANGADSTGAAYLFEASAESPIEWIDPYGGGWGTSDNWSGNTVPNGPTAHALFGGAIVGNTPVELNTNITVSRITFDNSTYNYYLYSYAGPELTLAGEATIDVVAGSHSLGVPLAGTSGLTKTGPGTLSISSNDSSYTGETRIEQGTLAFAGARSFGYSDTISVVTGGDVTSSLTSIGDLVTDSVTATVDGVGSTWTSTGDFYVGSNGTGVVNVLNGGAISSNLAYIGFSAGSHGNATLDGNGSVWNGANRVDIGYSGTAVVMVQNGADLVSSAELLIARLETSNGTLVVDGPGSTAITTGNLRLADRGVGLLTVQNGGSVTSFNGSLARDATAAQATAIIDGTGSIWSTTSGGLTLGNLGTATMTLRNGGTMRVQNGTGAVAMANNASSVATLQIGSGGGAGTLLATQVSGGSGNATLIFNHSDAAYNFAPALAGSLKVQHNGTGTTTLAGTRTYTGTTTVNAGKLVISGTHSGSTAYTVNTGGTLSGTGNIATSLTNHGRVAPGSPIGTLSTIGYTQSSTGTLEIEVGGLTAGTQHDRLSVTGISNVAGRLEMSFVNGFVPAVGQQVVYLTSTSTTGSFDSVVSPNLANIAPNVAMTLSTVGVGIRRVVFVAPSTTIQLNDPASSVVWSTPGSWLTSTVPASADIINLQNLAGAPQQINVQAANAFTHRLSVAGNANSMTVAVKNNFSLSATTSATISNNSTVSLFGSGSRLVSPSIAVEAGGQLTGNGAIYGNVSNGTTSGGPAAVFRPGDPNVVGLSAANLNVVGNFTQLSAGQTVIDFVGTSPGQWDKISVSGTANLDGNLTVNVASGVQLPYGQYFQIISAGAVSGYRPFETATLLGDVNSFLHLYYISDPIIPAITNVVMGRHPLGDMNLDGGVNMQDVSAFATAMREPLAYFTEFGAFGEESGDFDHDGDFDFDDIPGFSTKVQGGLAAVLSAIQNYGTGVPEPGTFTCAALALMTGLLKRSGRRTPS